METKDLRDSSRKSISLSLVLGHSVLALNDLGVLVVDRRRRIKKAHARRPVGLGAPPITRSLFG
jgi:hypothetical protein